MKSDRLLSELMLLQAYGRLSTRDLAERLEISQRTAHRDMESLCVAGVPLTALRGAHGGWELAKGWRTRVPGLDEAELRALLMVQPHALGDPRLIAAAERAFGKLMAALPASIRSQASSMQARLHIDHTSWQAHSEDLSMLPVVQHAIAQDVRLSFLYTRADGETAPRIVDPFGVVCKQNVWYLIARTANGMRTYRVSRMNSAIALTIAFKRPKSFDLGAHWRASTASLKQKPYVATIAFSPAAATSLGQWVKATPVKTTQTIPEDWLPLRLNFENEAHALFVSLGHGSRAQVLAPPELRRQVAAEIQSIARHAIG